MMQLNYNMQLNYVYLPYQVFNSVQYKANNSHDLGHCTKLLAATNYIHHAR
jgi:hypothetical protein